MQLRSKKATSINRKFRNYSEEMDSRIGGRYRSHSKESTKKDKSLENSRISGGLGDAKTYTTLPAMPINAKSKHILLSSELHLPKLYSKNRFRFNGLRWFRSITSHSELTSL